MKAGIRLVMPPVWWNIQTLLNELSIFTLHSVHCLAKMQIEFELEDDGPEIETVADSLGAAHLSDYHEEDRETFNFLLADLWN